MKFLLGLSDSENYVITIVTNHDYEYYHNSYSYMVSVSVHKYHD